MANTTPTQEFVPIKEIRDGIAILKDNSMRAVIAVSSLNFALKSTQEQEALIYQFQNFLNSLDFSIQISVQSRALDIKPYLETLQKQYNDQLNDLLKIQIQEYIGFIRNFTEEVSIMRKTFYVVIPFTPNILNSKSSGGFLSKIIGGGKKNTASSNSGFDENRTQIEQRIGVVQQGLLRCGLRSIELGTNEMVEIFYKLFNPGSTEKPIQMQ